MINFGTVNPGETLYIPFDTFDGGTGASITMTGLATTDIEIYKDGSMTQRASDAGYTLTDTDGTDLDGITGIQGFSIDLSNNTTAGFYASGSSYRVVVSSVTVDGQTVNFTAATFKIGYSRATLNTTIATLNTQTSFTLTSGPADDDALNGMEIVIHDVASSVQWGTAVVSDYVGSTRTVTLSSATSFAIAATDNIAVMGLAPLQPTAAGNTLDVSSTGAAGIDWGNVENATTTINFTNTTVGTCTSNTDMRGTDSAATAANLAIVDANVDAILLDTAEIGAAGAGLTAIPWNASWDAEVQSECNDAIVANHLDHIFAVDYDPASPPGVATALLNELVESDAGVSRFTVNALENAPSGSGASAEAIADAVWDEAQADHVAAGSFGETATEIASILADTGTDGVALSAAQMNAIADHILRRTWANAEASSDGDAVTFRSLIGAIAKLVNRVQVSGGNLLIYRDDDTTTLGTQALTTDASADPITEIDTV